MLLDFKRAEQDLTPKILALVLKNFHALGDDMTEGKTEKDM